MSKKLKTFKKSLSVFMVTVILFGTLGPAPLIFAENKKIGDTDLVLEKLESKRLEKTEQLRNFDSEEKTKEFNADESLKKISETKSDLKKQDYVQGEVLVKFKEQKINLEQSAGRTKAKQFAVSKSLDKKEDIRKSNISVLKIKDTKTVEEKTAELKNDPDVEYAQPNFLYYPLAIDTNDTHRDKLWGLDNIDDKDIDAPEAWAILDGTEEDIIVAVIDSGVAYNHPDLVNNMWDGSACVDENGNALGGCNHGYDYEDNDKTPLPTCSSHGTHIAGTIGAVKNNNIGILGVAPNVKIMVIKGLQILPTNQVVKGINFAKHNGAKVINASWGNGANNCNEAFDQALYGAIQNFDGLFIAAAGNDGKNHDGSTYFDSPSDYGHNTSCWTGLDNVINVAATDQNDNLWEDSDYGINFVDIGAPGVNIYSTGFVQELFTDASLPSFTNTLFTKTSGNWKTSTWADVGGDVSDKNAQANSSYVNNDHSVLTLTTPLDTTQIDSGDVWLSFYLQADIEYYNSSCSYDYLAVEIDNNDENWVQKGDKFCGEYNGKKDVNLGIGTSNMRVRFVWHTDEIVTKTQVPIIDDITISNTNSYQSCSGTSFAAPHVAGLAALIWGYDSELSYSEVKDVILTTGDELPNADDRAKIATGKRINAYSALNSLASSGTEVSGNITEDTTWTLANSPYIVTGTIQVLENVKLTIEPGVEVKFDQDTGLNIGGELNAIGIESEMITFTSNQDVPNPGDWIGIKFTDDATDAQVDSQNNYLSGSIIKYCVIEYGGGSSNGIYFVGAIELNRASPYVSNNIIRHNFSYDAGGGMFVYLASPIITHNTFSNNV